MGYDCDTFAADLNPPLEHLDLTGVVLGGFTVGTGEVTLRLARYGSGRVAKAVMFGGSRRSCSRPITIPRASTSSIRETKASIVKDQYGSFEVSPDNFYNTDKVPPGRISDWAWQAR